MKFRFEKKYLYWGVTAFCVIAASILFFMLLNRWESVKAVFKTFLSALSPIIAGLVISYLLSPILNFIEKYALLSLTSKFVTKSERAAKGLSRALGIAAVMILVVVFLAGLILMVIPQLIISIEKLVMNMDSYLFTARELLDNLLLEIPDLELTVLNMLDSSVNLLTSWLEDSILSRVDVIIRNVSSGVLSVIGAVVNFIIGGIISVYILYSKEVFAAQCKKLMYAVFKPKRAAVLIEGSRSVHKMFGGFFLGKVLASIIVGAICAIFMLITRMPYVPLISVIIAITNIIPFFGPIIGAVPCAFLLLLESPLQCFIFVVFIIVLQTFDGNILSAKILGNNTGLTGFWVIFAIMVGGGLFGFIGMVCGVPVFAVVYQFVSNAVRRELKKRKLPVETDDYSDKLVIPESASSEDGEWSL